MLTRREFLEIAARRSAAAGVAAAAALSACGRTSARPSALGLDADRTEILIALVDEIIPSNEKMPAASQVGTLAYWELIATSEPQLRTVVQDVVSAAEAIAVEAFSRP